MLNVEAHAALNPPDDRAAERAALEAGISRLDRAIAILKADAPGAIGAALAALDADERAAIEAQPRHSGFPTHMLAHLLNETFRQPYQHLLDTMSRRDALAGHLRGLALDPEILGRLARYETHLDRKFERTLAMLLKLQAMRALPSPASQGAIPDDGAIPADGAGAGR